MKKIIVFFASAMVMLGLSGCGSSSSSSSGVSNMMPASDPSAVNMNVNMDIGSLLNGLSMDTTNSTLSGTQESGGEPITLLNSDDDSDDNADDDATNTAPPAFVRLGSVGIEYEGTEYPMLAVSSRDRADILAPYYTRDVDGSYIIKVAAYDVREERLYPDTGSLIFSFKMRDLEATGNYPLTTYFEGESGEVVITYADQFNDKTRLKGYIDGATFYSVSKDMFYTVNLSFDVTVLNSAH
jgi:hypothetical protein